MQLCSFLPPPSGSTVELLCLPASGFRFVQASMKIKNKKWGEGTGKTGRGENSNTEREEVIKKENKAVKDKEVTHDISRASLWLPDAGHNPKPNPVICMIKRRRTFQMTN